MVPMTLYHGSAQVVTRSLLELCKPYNDYGRGFYCTQSKELAQEWAALSNNQPGFANKYCLDLTGLEVLDLDEAPYSVLNWVAVLMLNRRVNYAGKADNALADKFVEAYGVDFSGADVVMGCRADDSYFSIARAFTLGQLTVDELEQVLKAGGLGRQVVLKSQRAFDALKFEEATPGIGTDWYRRRQDRMRLATMEFRRVLAAGGSNDSASPRFADICRGL